MLVNVKIIMKNFKFILNMIKNEILIYLPFFTTLIEKQLLILIKFELVYFYYSWAIPWLIV